MYEKYLYIFGYVLIYQCIEKEYTRKHLQLLVVDANDKCRATIFILFPSSLLFVPPYIHNQPTTTAETAANPPSLLRAPFPSQPSSDGRIIHPCEHDESDSAATDFLNSQHPRRKGRATSEGYGGRELGWKKLAFIPARMEKLASAAMAMEWQCGVVEPPPPILSVLVLPPSPF